MKPTYKLSAISFIASIVVLCLLSPLAVAAAPTTAQPKNVILVLIDDLGYGDIAAHGNPVVQTPHLDALRASSAHFTNFAVSPTCAPTRAALLTGKHEFKSSVTHTLPPMRNMDLAATTLAELFQRQGFVTGLFGKWHLGQSGRYGPWFRGFDETLTVAGDNQKSHFDPVLLQNRKPTPFKGYRTDIIFDQTMDFLERHREQPFFCYLPTYSPHGPLKVPPQYIEPYQHLEPKAAAYYGMVAKVDENLGRLLAKMKSTGLDANTLLIVMSDNGATFGVDTWNAGMRGRKSSAWRGGTRALAFWRYGDQYAPGERGQMTGQVDVLPTLADLFGLEVGEALAAQLEGDSLRPLLEDAQAELDESRMQVHHRGRWHEPSRWQAHKYTHACVRWKNYQLLRTDTCDQPDCPLCARIRRRAAGRGHLGYSSNVEHYRMTEPGEWALYDIEADPFQEHNLTETKPEIRDKMAAHYEAWWAEVAPILAQSAKRRE